MSNALYRSRFKREVDTITQRETDQQLNVVIQCNLKIKGFEIDSYRFTGVW